MSEKIRYIVLHYGGAVLLTALAVGVRWLIDPWMGDHLPLATLYGAVALSVWFGGYRPAVVVVVLGYLACDWLFIQPRGSFGFDSLPSLIGLLTYLLSCSIIVGFGQAMRSARRNADASRDRLEQEAARHREAEQRFRLAANAVNGIIYEYDFQTGHVERTRGLYEVLGYDPGEVPPTQAWWVEQIHPDDLGRVAKVDPAVVRATNAPVEYRLRHKDGRWLHVEDRAVLLKDGEGKPVKLVGCTVDVTARKRAEEERAELLARLETLFANAPIGIALFDPDLRFITLNEQAAVVDGVPKDSHLGKTVTELLPELGPKVEALLRRVRDTGESITGLEVSGETPAAPGQQRHWLANYYPMRNGGGKVVGIGAVALEITDRKRAEERLRQSEAFTRTLLGASLSGMYVYDVDAGRNVFVNPQYTKITGYTQADLDRMDRPSFLTLFHAEDRDAVLAHMKKVIEAGPGCESEIEYRFKTADGRWAYLLSRDTLLPQGDGPGRRFLGTFVDITERKRAAEAVRLGKARLDFTLEATGIGMWLNTLPFGRLNWDSRTKDLFHLPPGVEPTIELFWSRLHPDDREPTRLAVEAAMRDRTLYSTDHRVVDPETSEVRWVRSMGKVSCDEGGTPVRFDGINYDITDRKRLEDELRQTAAALSEAHRRKDEFLATLAHELRNPLAPIRNAVQIVKAKSPDIPELVWARDLIERQVGQMARLLDDLLDVSRITRNKLELRKGRVTLAGVVESAVETSRPLIDAEGHELAVALPSEPVYLDADPVRLAQVFSNLLNNAAKYTDRGGHIRIAAERVGHEVVVSVKDDGIGIERNMLPHLFEMFSQATPALERSQGGLGIGLSLVKGLVEMHGGGIEAHSDGPGKGSEFVVRLPVALPPKEAEERSTEAEKPMPAGCRIVVADDNRDAADSLAMLLRMMGNEVHTAHDGLEAVKVTESFRPDVVLLDIGMPRLNGYDACRRIREQPWGRDMLIVALTGWGQEDDKRRSQEAGFTTHMVKPVATAALARLLAARAAPRGG